MSLSEEQINHIVRVAEYRHDSGDKAAMRAYFEREVARMSAEELHALARQLNWDDDDTIDRLRRLINHPRCDRGTALQIYWTGEPTFYLGYETRDRVRNELWPEALATYDLLREIEQLVLANRFATAEIPFDPFREDGMDWTTCTVPHRWPRVEPVAVYRTVRGARVRLNEDAPLGPPIDPREKLPAIMFEPVRGRGGDRARRERSEG